MAGLLSRENAQNSVTPVIRSTFTGHTRAPFDKVGVPYHVSHLTGLDKAIFPLTHFKDEVGKVLCDKMFHGKDFPCEECAKPKSFKGKQKKDGKPPAPGTNRPQANFAIFGYVHEEAGQKRKDKDGKDTEYDMNPELAIEFRVDGDYSSHLDALQEADDAGALTTDIFEYKKQPKQIGDNTYNLLEKPCVAPVRRTKQLGIEGAPQPSLQKFAEMTEAEVKGLLLMTLYKVTDEQWEILEKHGEAVKPKRVEAEGTPVDTNDATAVLESKKK